MLSSLSLIGWSINIVIGIMICLLLLIIIQRTSDKDSLIFSNKKRWKILSLMFSLLTSFIIVYVINIILINYVINSNDNIEKIEAINKLSYGIEQNNNSLGLTDDKNKYIEINQYKINESEYNMNISEDNKDILKITYIQFKNSDWQYYLYGNNKLDENYNIKLNKDNEMSQVILKNEY